MAETSTFSALVDNVIARSQRRDRVNDIVAYARSTIRECQVLAFFEQDMVEEQLSVTVLPFVWDRPLHLRTILAASPDEIFTRRDRQRWFKNIPPGQKIRDEKYYLYLSGDSFVFTGEDLTVGDTINIAYFTYARKFVYYALADRPATFDDETETWSYATAYDTNDTQRKLARDLVNNWLLFHWYDLILEGTLAKLFKTVGDERSKTSFSLYKSYQEDLKKGERVIYLRGMHDLNG